jgi:hypothetical protein
LAALPPFPHVERIAGSPTEASCAEKTASALAWGARLAASTSKSEMTPVRSNKSSCPAIKTKQLTTNIVNPATFKTDYSQVEIVSIKILTDRSKASLRLYGANGGPQRRMHPAASNRAHATSSPTTANGSTAGTRPFGLKYGSSSLSLTLMVASKPMA